MIPTGTLGLEVRFRAYVPIDDDHTMMWTITGKTGMRPGRDGLRATGQQVSTGQRPEHRIEAQRHRLAGPLPPDPEPRQRLPDRPRAAEVWRELHRHPRRHAPAGHGRHRTAWARSTTATTSTWAPPTADHPHAPPHDQRRKALRDQGVTPPGVDNPEVYRQRSGGVVLRRELDWWEGTRTAAGLREARRAGAARRRVGHPPHPTFSIFDGEGAQP